MLQADGHAHELRCDSGGALSLCIEAADSDVISGPNVGISDSFTFRVVTPDDLRDHLLRREQELRLEFERTLRDQRTLLEDSRALLAAQRRAADTPRAAGEPLASGKAALVKTNERKQRLLRERCRGVATRFSGILDEARNNRIDEDGALSRRIGAGIVSPLQATSDGAVVRAADALDTALRVGVDPLKALDQVVVVQRRAVTEMEAVLRNMMKWESYEEAVRLLREVLNAQRRVHGQTRSKIEGRIRDIFEE